MRAACGQKGSLPHSGADITARTDIAQCYLVALEPDEFKPAGAFPLLRSRSQRAVDRRDIEARLDRLQQDFFRLGDRLSGEQQGKGT